MIVEPVTLPPDALVSDAVDVMERYHISGVPITDERGKLVGILTNRDLRFERDLTQPVSALMTSQGPRHGTRRHDARGGGAPPAPPSHREAADRRRRRPHHRTDHGQGHPEARRVPAGDEGRAGPPARRRRGRRRPGRGRARAGSRRRRRGRARRRHRARPLARRARDGRPHRGALRRVRADRGEHRDRRGRRGADRRGRRRGQGGQGPGAICTTRVVAGVGVPQITAVYDDRRGRVAPRGAGDRRRRASPRPATSPRRSPPARTR